MYIPKHFRVEQEEELLSFMQAYSFATIVTTRDNLPVASHLPFSVFRREGKIILGAHFAKANPQWEHIDKGKVLVIFSEPHAYISPKHYDRQESVPTWNYIAVHAYGTAVRITDTASVMEMLEGMIDQYEPDYKQQWNGLSADYKLKMINGIVAFEILVEELQAAEKLSQNKSLPEQKRISDSLSASSLETERKIAEYMRRNLD